MSQAVGRLSPAMFKARRTGAAQLDLPDGSPEALGYEFIRYAQELSIPQKWNTYFPTPDRKTSSDAAKAGITFFLRSLEWILRHELAHIALHHPDSPLTRDQCRAEERESDLHATRALKGDLAADLSRPPGAKPSENELELERRALAAGIGLVWVGVYERVGTTPSGLYPPVSDRIFRCLEEFGLAQDSAAAEILSDLIKTWIDPTANWPALPPDEATAQAAMDEACSRLDEYIQAFRMN
jgi:hypothetical protein